MIKIFFYLKCGFDPKVLRQFFEEHGEAVSFFGALPPPRAPNKSKTLYGVNSARGEGERNRLWWTRWDLNPRPPGCPAPKFVDPKGFEPLTSRMQTECSTIELKALFVKLSLIFYPVQNLKSSLSFRDLKLFC